jgi:hypothetical protein
MRIAVTLLVIALAGVSVFGQSPTLQVVTSDPNLPSELFYGNVKVKPLRVRPGTNPPQLITIDDSDFFVQQQYVDFLSRMPDSSGFGFWNAQITICGGDAACIDAQRSNVSAAFYLSIEFQSTGYLVERMYKAAYGSPDGQSLLGGAHTLKVPVVRLSEFLPDTKEIGAGVVVGQGNWQQQLENNKQAFATDFVSRSRFTTAFPATWTPLQFVDALNTNAGNPLSPATHDNLVNALTNQTMTRAQVVRAVAEDQNLSNAEFNRAFVLMQYFGYLRRDPNNGNGDIDYTGYDFWLTKLNQAPGDHDHAFINAEMVKSFLVSGEYRGRF